MAPGRRKGSSKAAAMAAAKRNWKVGDLVLAKVKGFPAWPATVSEPSQWGYTSDRKKVLVYFFGTQQIAFCNHNDVEAFTEEKKKTLLVKRQGKGADFVRAVEEIIKSYEKLKEQCHGDESAGVDHSISSNARNAECLQGELLGSPRRSPQKETLNASTEKVKNLEVRAAQLVVDDPSDVATVSENPNDSASILSQIREASAGVGSPLGKRENDESLVMQRRISSLRRCRSSLKVDPYRVQKSVMPPTDIHQPGTDVSRDVFMKHRLIKNSLNNSDSDNKNSFESDTVISYGNGDGIGSENIKLESDSMDMNEGSTIDSYCETEDVSLSGRLDFGTTAVVFRKKRKPSKKRVVPDAAVCVGLKREETFQDGLSNSPSCSPNLCNNVDERVNKTDGDKHLPLVKRARARMSKPSVDENLLDDSFCNMEINQSTPEIGQKLTEEFSTYNSNDGTGSLNSASLVVTEAEKSISISNGSMEVAENGSLLWKSKRYRVGFVDGEAALPPSKRIHRALEAMSANVAEASNSSTEVQETSEILSNGRRSSPETASVHIPTESNIGTPLEAHNKQSFQSDILPEKASAHLSTDSNICCSLEAHYIQSSQSDISEVPAMTSLETTSDDMLVEGIKIHQHCGEDVDKFRDDPSLAKKIDTGLSADRSSSFITYDMPDIDASSQSSLRHLSTEESNEEILPPTGGSSKDVTNKEIVCSKKGDFHVESEMEIIMEKSDNLSKLKGVGNLMPVDGIPVSTLVQEGSSVICDSMHPSRSQSDVISGVNYMYDGMEEFKYQPVQRGMSFTTDLKSMKVLIAAAHAKRQLHRHFSLPHHVQDVVSDAYPHFKVDSSEKLYASDCMGSEIHGLGDWSKILNSADRALDISLHEKSFVNSFNIDGEGRFDSRQNLDKFASRDEANVARKSFEAMLCVLSRTKESIGRATRLAIDCAKYGIAGEVVEILLRNLEEESSMNRKIDLFFLVDSITQCSRGQKGGPDAYPSLVQAVLPRFLSAAAPPGHAALENRRQCMKVLRLWLERKTLPESVVRHHMRELDSLGGDASLTGGFSRRPLRTERAMNDPVREMEGILVDEYGSNTSFSLPGFLVPRILEDEEEGNDTEGKCSFTVLEKCSEIADERSSAPQFISNKHKHILEDVDGELEMEDVAPSCDVVTNSVCPVTRGDAVNPSGYHLDRLSPFVPPLPDDKPPSPPPLPSSPPPSVPPPPLVPSCPPLSSHALSLPTSDPTSHLISDTLDQRHHDVEHKALVQSTQQLDSSNANSSSDGLPSHAPHYGGLPNQLLTPVFSYSSSTSYNSIPGSHPSIDRGNRDQPRQPLPLPKKAYHLQPPPPTVSNQFSYVQAEPREKIESWGEHSSPSLNGKLRFAHDRYGGDICSDTSNFGPVRHESVDGYRFSAPVHSGSVNFDKHESSCTSHSYSVPPSERGWSYPPRASTYLHSAHTSGRSQGNPFARVAGVPNYWRPR